MPKPESVSGVQWPDGCVRYIQGPVGMTAAVSCEHGYRAYLVISDRVPDSYPSSEGASNASMLVPFIVMLTLLIGRRSRGLLR